MTTTYTLAPLPKWVLIDNSGRTAGGAKLYTYSALNPTLEKPVYQDPNGSIPYTNPILFDANGTQGPFYWESDSANPDDLYYIEAYDSNDNLLWTQNNFSGDSGGGGGGGTTYVNLNNLISNNVFSYNVGTVNTSSQTNVVLAPSNHVGFTPDSIPYAPANGGVGPDIRFLKSNTSATDEISFVDFNLGENPLTGDTTPLLAVRYRCTAAGSGETFKCIQFPINAKVNTLDNQAMTFTVWAKTQSGSSDLGLTVRQYFGSGGSPTNDAINVKGSETIDTNWEKLAFNFVTNSVGGVTLGTCGDDATYFRLDLPLNQACDIYFIKPSAYLGSISPALDFDSYDEVNALALAQRSGDVRISINKFQPFGWVPCNDGSIGSVLSSATTRANIDTFFLYKTIWDLVSNTYAPVTGGRGADAMADFNANKPLFLTKTLGRMLAGTWTQTALTFTVDQPTSTLTISSTAQYQTGNPVVLSTTGALQSPLQAGVTYYCINTGSTTLKLAATYADAIASTAITLTTTTPQSGTCTITTPPYALGQPIGNETHTLTIAEMPAHQHNVASSANGSLGSSANGNLILGVQDSAGGSPSFGNIGLQGGGQPHSIMSPATFYNIFLKL